MFEQVGQQKTNRRRALGPLLLTIVLNVAGLTTLVVNSGTQIVSHFQNPMPDFVVSFPKPAPPGPPAAAAAAAKPKATPKPRVEPEPEVEPEVDPEPVEAVEPTEPVEPAEPSDAPDAGGGGIGGGDAEIGGGGGECPPGQICDGDSPACPPGMLCDGDSLFVSSADVRVKRRVSPRYPDAAKSLNLQETRCIVTFSIDQKGKPSQVSIDGCPTVFHPALREAAMKWRFYPVKDANGQPQPASFRLSTIFRLR